MCAAKKAAAGKPGCKTSAAVEGQFVRGLLTRGEAVPEGRTGKVPSGVTHWLTGKQGKASLKRVRFSAK